VKLIFLNGPPRSGKDSAAFAICKTLERWGLPCEHDKLSAPIKRAFAGLVDAPMQTPFNVYYYEAHKEEPIPMLSHKSYRKWQIEFAECFIRPLYGETTFSKLLEGRCKNGPLDMDSIIVVSDCGFQEEVDYLCASPVFTEALLIRCLREKCTFDGDSREYISPNPEDKHVVFRVAYNDGSLADWEHKVTSYVGKWLGHPVGRTLESAK
jgi:hypothetical protein